MDQAEALRKIEEIHKVMEGSNKALFSGERMMIYGVLVLLIPFIERFSQGLTFGNQWLSQNDMLMVLIHTLLYLGLFKAVGKMKVFKKADRGNAHPLIQKAFSIGSPIIITIIGICFAFMAIGQGQYIHPLVFILLGLMFGLYGRFTTPGVVYIAWSYILIGLLYIYLTQFHIENLWIYMMAYNGLSYIAMGYFLRKDQRG